MHWQVKGPNGVSYYDPATSSLVLEDCRLVNRRSVAEKVLSSQRRDVCGYVRCRAVRALSEVLPPEGGVVHFDPKVHPYWTVEGRDGSQDGSNFPVLVSSGRRLRTPKLNRAGSF